MQEDIIKEGNSIILRGKLAVVDAFRLKDALVESKNAHGGTVLDLRDMERFDMSILQLLMAFLRENPATTVLPPKSGRLFGLLEKLGVLNCS